MSKAPNRDQSPKRYRFFVPKTPCRVCNARILEGMGFSVVGLDLCCCCAGHCEYYAHECRQCEQSCCMYLNISHMYKHDQLCCLCFASDDSEETCVCCFNIALEKKKWILIFLAQGLGCDVPILESIWHNWIQKWHSFIGNVIFHRNVSDLKQIRRLIADNTSKGTLVYVCLSLREGDRLQSQLDRDALRYVLRRNLMLLLDYLDRKISDPKWQDQYKSFSFVLARQKLTKLSTFLKDLDPELNKEFIPKIADHLTGY